MPVFKCKMCGAPLQIKGKETIVECEYCDTMQTLPHISNKSSIDTMLERVNIFLQDSEWDKADEYCEKILDIEPKFAYAYLCKLLAECNIRNIEEARSYIGKPWRMSPNFDKFLRYADDLSKEKILELVSEQEAKLLEATKPKVILSLYNAAVLEFNKAVTEAEYKKVIEILNKIIEIDPDNKKAQKLIALTENKINEYRSAIQRYHEQERIDAENKRISKYLEPLIAVVICLTLLLGVSVLVITFVLYDVLSGYEQSIFNTTGLMFLDFYFIFCMYMQIKSTIHSKYIKWTLITLVTGLLMVFVYGLVFPNLKIFMMIIAFCVFFFFIVAIVILKNKIKYGSKKPNIFIMAGILASSIIALGISAFIELHT